MLQFPALSDGSVHLWGLSAVAFYLSPLLKGENALQQAQVLQWLNLAEQEVLPAVLSMLTPAGTSGRAGAARARLEVLRQLTALDALLLNRTYLVGEKVTLSDVAVCCALLPAFQKAFGAAERSSVKNVMRWMNTIVHQPAVQSVIGEVKYF